MGVITLLTDFGTRDWFVGSMKGVILGIDPVAEIVDLTHEVPPQDITSAAVILRSACGYFPEGTVHMAVVDPGVGTERRAIAARTRRHFLVGPDNGVLHPVLDAEGGGKVVEIRHPRARLASLSRTFHGRDLFAPAAAHLSLGVPLEELGPPLREIVPLELPRSRRVEKGKVEGEVLYVDRFGNLVTTIREEDLEGWPPGEVEVVVGEIRASGLRPSYASGREGEPIALFGSIGYLEVALPGGNVAVAAGIGRGERVSVVSARRRRK